MVNIQHIHELVDRYFTHTGQIQIDPVTGKVSCTGSVNLQPHHHFTSLPVQFDQVGGHFNCDYNHLESLRGCPHSTGLYFSCRNNPLKTLQGLPDQIGALCWVTYTPTLPLLRLLHLPFYKVKIASAPKPVADIMLKYAGQGKAVALNCALELKKAGYPENAQW